MAGRDRYLHFLNIMFSVIGDLVWCGLFSKITHYDMKICGEGVDLVKFLSL